MAEIGEPVLELHERGVEAMQEGEALRCLLDRKNKHIMGGGCWKWICGGEEHDTHERLRERKEYVI